jgi:hypothetical protein
LLNEDKQIQGSFIRQHKRGTIADDLPPILQQLKLPSEQGVELSSRLEHRD